MDLPPFLPKFEQNVKIEQMPIARESVILSAKIFPCKHNALKSVQLSLS